MSHSKGNVGSMKSLFYRKSMKKPLREIVTSFHEGSREIEATITGLWENYPMDTSSKGIDSAQVDQVIPLKAQKTNVKLLNHLITGIGPSMGLFNPLAAAFQDLDMYTGKHGAIRSMVYDHASHLSTLYPSKDPLDLRDAKSFSNAVVENHALLRQSPRQEALLFHLPYLYHLARLYRGALELSSFYYKEDPAQLPRRIIKDGAKDLDSLPILQIPSLTDSKSTHISPEEIRDFESQLSRMRNSKNKLTPSSKAKTKIQFGKYLRIIHERLFDVGMDASNHLETQANCLERVLKKL